METSAKEMSLNSLSVEAATREVEHCMDAAVHELRTSAAIIARRKRLLEKAIKKLDHAKARDKAKRDHDGWKARQRKGS